jgi:hypothetical protein
MLRKKENGHKYGKLKVYTNKIELEWQEDISYEKKNTYNRCCGYSSGLFYCKRQSSERTGKAAGKSRGFRVSDELEKEFYIQITV